jgi:hypothetical protein
LKQQSDKKPSLKNRYVSLPSSTSPPYVDKWIELSSSAKKLPKASKSGAFAMNNVLDFSERISFFWHMAYEKHFLGRLQNVLSFVVTSMKRLHL